MIRLTSWEVYSFIFKITEENSKFDLYTDTFEEFRIEELKVELEEILSISDITTSHLQHEKKAQVFFQAYRKFSSEKSSTDGYIRILMAHGRSPVRDFGSFPRIVFGLDEDDIQLILKQNNSKFIKYERPPGVYSI